MPQPIGAQPRNIQSLSRRPQAFYTSGGEAAISRKFYFRLIHYCSLSLVHVANRWGVSHKRPMPVRSDAARTVNHRAKYELSENSLDRLLLCSACRSDFVVNFLFTTGEQRQSGHGQ